jgi:hypothetical protein
MVMYVMKRGTTKPLNILERQIMSWSAPTVAPFKLNKKLFKNKHCHGSVGRQNQKAAARKKQTEPH